MSAPIPSCLSAPSRRGDGTATATAAMAVPLFTAEINNSFVIRIIIIIDLELRTKYQRPALNRHLLCQFETAAVLCKQNGCEF